MGDLIFQTECPSVLKSWKIIPVVRRRTSQPRTINQPLHPCLRPEEAAGISSLRVWDSLKEDQKKCLIFFPCFPFMTCYYYLKLEQGWMIQWPMAFCRTLSFIRAFLEPNSFMASLLSVGAKIFWSWFLTQPGLDSLETEFLGRKCGSNIPREDLRA